MKEYEIGNLELEYIIFKIENKKLHRLRRTPSKITSRSCSGLLKLE